MGSDDCVAFNVYTSEQMLNCYTYAGSTGRWVNVSSFEHNVAYLKESEIDRRDGKKKGAESDSGCSKAQEPFEGLCYVTCNHASRGKFPIRTAACTCRTDTENTSVVSVANTNCVKYGVSQLPGVSEVPDADLE